MSFMVNNKNLRRCIMNARKRVIALLVASVMMLTAIPTVNVWANNDVVLATIGVGQIFEFRNLTNRAEQVRFSGRQGSFGDFYTYHQNGDGATGGRGRGAPLGWRPAQGQPRLNPRMESTVPAGGKLVVELRVGSPVEVRGNREAFQVGQLQTPVLHARTISRGVTEEFVNSGGGRHSVGWTSDGYLGNHRVQGGNLITRHTIRADGTSTNPSTPGSASGTPTELGDIVVVSWNRDPDGSPAVVAWGSHTIFSGQPYRATVCGQRSFPPGLERDISTPLEQTASDYYELYRMLNSRNFEQLFGDYFQFSNIWLDDVKLLDVALLGLTSEIRRAMVSGIISGDFERTVNSIKNNPAQVQAIVRDIINQMAGTQVYSADKMTANMLSTFADTLGALDSNAKYFFTFLKESDSGLELLSRHAVDYYNNIAMLESLRGLTTAPLFNQTINNVIREYRRTLAQSFGRLGRDFVVNKTIDYAIGLIAGKPIVALTSALDLAIGTVPRVSTLETMIVTTTIAEEANIAFRVASRRIAQGNFDSSHVESYRAAFYLARGLQIVRYEAKLAHFRRGTAESNHASLQLRNLRQMTHYNFIYSTRFRR